MLLLNELFKRFNSEHSQKSNQAITAVIVTVMPSVLIKTVAKEGFIKVLAKNVMKNGLCTFT